MRGEMTREEFIVDARKNEVSEQQAKDMADVLEAKTADIKRQMSSAEKLGLPPLLEAARQKYHLIDGYFESLPCDDRCFIYQLKMNESKTFLTDGKIIRPQVNEKRDRHESVRGILLAWGLKAQDELECQGWKLGHEVEYIELAPYIKVVGHVYGESEAEYVLVLRAGTMVGNRTLEQERRAGRYRVETARSRVVSGGKPTSVYMYRHCIRGEDGELMLVQQPVELEDL